MRQRKVPLPAALREVGIRRRVVRDDDGVEIPRHLLAQLGEAGPPAHGVDRAHDPETE